MSLKNLKNMLGESEHLMSNWPVSKRWQNSMSALLAMLICTGMLQQLNRQLGEKWKRRLIDEPTSMMTLRLIPFMPLSAPDRILPKPNLSIKPFTQVLRPKLTPAPLETSEANLVSNSSTAVPPAPPISAETPEPLSSLRFDREAIARAYKESKSEIQKMAEASGKYESMTTLPPSKSERYQAGIAQGYKPDCVSKATGGAGLLAIPLIGYLIASDKCNFRK